LPTRALPLLPFLKIRRLRTALARNKAEGCELFIAGHCTACLENIKARYDNLFPTDSTTKIRCFVGYASPPVDCRLEIEAVVRWLKDVHTWWGNFLVLWEAKTCCIGITTELHDGHMHARVIASSNSLEPKSWLRFPMWCTLTDNMVPFLDHGIKTSSHEKNNCENEESNRVL
jgi:hypothetical protein